MAILHLCAENDSHEHLLDHQEGCSCTPQVIEEGTDANGYLCRTVIHQVIQPLKENAKKALLKKVWLDATDGHVLKIDTAIQRQQYFGKIRLRGEPRS